MQYWLENDARVQRKLLEVEFWPLPRLTHIAGRFEGLASIVHPPTGRYSCARPCAEGLDLNSKTKHPENIRTRRVIHRVSVTKNRHVYKFLMHIQSAWWLKDLMSEISSLCDYLKTCRNSISKHSKPPYPQVLWKLWKETSRLSCFCLGSVLPAGFWQVLWNHQILEVSRLEIGYWSSTMEVEDGSVSYRFRVQKNSWLFHLTVLLGERVAIH